MSQQSKNVVEKEVIKTALFSSKAPLEWAIGHNGTLYTAQIPIDSEGQLVEGGIEAQTRKTLDNLMHTLECAGVSSQAVLQVLIYVTDREYLPTVNRSTANILKHLTPTALRWSSRGWQGKACWLSWWFTQRCRNNEEFHFQKRSIKE